MEIGDVVYLKSGGPSMTVQAFPEKDSVQVQWFSGSEPRSAEFPVASLVVDDPTPALSVSREKATAALEAATSVQAQVTQSIS